jgi:methylamine--corrinoid protein Co-methyltransferase
MMKKDNFEYLASVLEKADTGPVIEEKDWDYKYIGAKTKELIKKYDISWEKNEYVPSDDGLADRLFQAGWELALESGVYCRNTKKQMLWTEEELKEVIDSGPSELVVGTGDDEVVLRQRRPEQPSRVTILGGAYGTLIEEDLFGAMVEAYAKESLIDIVEPPSIPTAFGRTIRIQSPWEVMAARRESDLALAAVKRAGRPGICIGAAATSGSEIIELAATSYNAYRQTDWHHTSFVSENKVTYADLTRAAHFYLTGSVAHTFCDPIYGGYLGGKEGVAIGCVAGPLLLRAALLGDTVNAGPSHAHVSCDTHPDMLAAQALSFQALARNTHLLKGIHIRPAHGPGTKEILYEVAAMAILGVTSGVDYLKSVQSACGVNMGHTSPVEARLCAQVAHASEALSREEGNDLVTKLVNKYQDLIPTADTGKHFRETYNLEILEPAPAWQKIYEEVISELRELGLSI